MMNKMKDYIRYSQNSSMIDKRFHQQNVIFLKNKLILVEVVLSRDPEKTAGITSCHFPSTYCIEK